MHYYMISITIELQLFEEFFECISAIFADMYQKFIILNKYEFIKNKNKISVVICSNYDTSYINQFINTYINKKSFNKEYVIETEKLGITYNGNGLCKCNNKEIYIMHNNESQGPLICYKCFKNINVFELLKNNNRLISELHIWASGYENMYNYWLNSIDDELSLNQLGNLDSNLIKYGLYIRSLIESTHNLQVLYPIISEKHYNKCPMCGNLISYETNLNKFDGICNNCRLLFSFL